MNARILALVLSFSLVGTVAHADESTWSRLTATVKVKVQEWMNYWAPPATVATAPVVAVAKPVIAPKPVAVVVPVPTAPVAPAVVVAPKRAPVKDLSAWRDAVKAKTLLSVSQAGHRGTSALKQSNDGVPLTDWRNFKSAGKIVPRLDIGRESEIKAADFQIESVPVAVHSPEELNRLVTPKASLINITPVKVYGPRGLQATMRTVGAPISRESIAKIQYAVHEAKDSELKPYHPMSDEELKMVAALILFERGDHCHMVMGLFHQLAAKEKTKSEATYYLGACAAKLKMEQVAFDNLSSLVANDDKEFGADALELLAQDLPVIYEQDFYRTLKAAKNLKAMITPKSQDNVAYRMAKGAYRAGDYKTSLDYAMRVNSGTNYSDDAKFLSAMNSFALNDRPAALKKLQDLSASLESRKVQDKNILALTQTNLARMYFGLKKYDLAFKAYMQVPKDHPLWVQALIEQGWTQLALEDNAGAIGNMYSLHSPYFKAVYQPESFVVRAIGYLSICQYGDAYRTLTWLEKDYRDMFDKAQTYFKNTSEPSAVYASVKTYIRGKSTENVEGVPYQVWRDLAHRKDFLNLQTALNDKQDEAHRYDGVNQKIKDEKAGIRSRSEASKKRFDKFRQEVANVKNVKGVVHGREEWEAGMKRERENTIGYRFQLTILELSREGFLDFQGKAQSKLDHETAGLTTSAGQSLVRHAKNMSTQMQGVLENNEFLRYEVFSGSGEDIRYQVAGGKVGQSNRIPASIKPAKMLNWSFDGEFWEDEIGSYRSSLRNVCPTTMTQQAQAVPEDVDN